VGISGNTFIGGNCKVTGKMIARNITAGYMYNSGAGTEGYLTPIPCSMKQIQPDNVDDGWVVNPGYKFKIYGSASYSGLTQTIDNYTGTDVSYVAASPANNASSVGVYWLSDSTEITLTTISS
jgi:hypothetical protein